MADQLLFEQSSDSQVTSEPFISRQVVYVIDQNNGNYSGQIQLDTSSLSNSGKYASYSEAYLQVPLVLSMAGSAAVFGNAAPFSVGLKNLFANLIHSVSVEYNNTNVIQLTPYSNFYVTYKLMTTLSEGDVKKIGPTIGFYPDTSTSYRYAQGAASTVGGQGVRNNRNATQYDLTSLVAGALANAGAVGVTYPNLTANDDVASWTAFGNQSKNEGFASRQQDIALQYDAQTISLITQDNGQKMGINSYEQVGNNHFWYIMATIRLKDMHDFFDKMPLVKGAYLRFLINVNTCSHTLNFTAAGLMSQDSATTAANGTSPVLVSSGEVGQGFRPLTNAIITGAAPVTATVRLEIGKKLHQW